MTSLFQHLTFKTLKQRSPRRLTLGLQSVRAPGGIRTHDLSLSQRIALSAELQTHAERNLDGTEISFRKISEHCV